jgi:hypothetical protein
VIPSGQVRGPGILFGTWCNESGRFAKLLGFATDYGYSANVRLPPKGDIPQFPLSYTPIPRHARGMAGSKSFHVTRVSEFAIHVGRFRVGEVSPGDFTLMSLIDRDKPPLGAGDTLSPLSPGLGALV